MAKNNATIKQEIEEFVVSQGGDYPEFYIGITNNFNRRIVESEGGINEHLRSGRYEDGSDYYLEECNSREDAVEIEQYFQHKGMQGYNPGAKGKENSRYIYCFKQNPEYIKDKRIKKIIRETLSELEHFDDFDTYVRKNREAK